MDQNHRVGIYLWEIDEAWPADICSGVENTHALNFPDTPLKTTVGGIEGLSLDPKASSRCSWGRTF